MIFITVGSQKFQFNRLLKKIDELIIDGTIKEKVFAQIGVSDYVPENYQYVDFMTQDEFNNKIEESDLVITHAGTGVIINSIKRGKKVIGVPRLAKYGEHVDDHQIQLLNEFKELNYIKVANDTDELKEKIENIKNEKFETYVSNTKEIIEDIRKFIEGANK